MVFNMFSREFAVFILLAAAVLSSELKFRRVSGNRKTDAVYVWEEANPVKVSCQDMLDATENPEKMRLWWELNDEKTWDQFVYNSESLEISVETAVTYAMAKDGDSLYCVLAVADSDQSTFVTTHKKKLPLKPIELTLAAQPNMIAALYQNLFLYCTLSGEDFAIASNVNLDLKVINMNTGKAVILDGTTYYDNKGHIVAKFKVPTDTISTKKFKCAVTDYTFSTDVAVSVSIIGLIKNLEPYYVVPEGGAVSELEAEVNNYAWAESGYPKITFTLNGNALGATTGATASELNLKKNQFPVSFKVDYKGEDADQGYMFAPNFFLISTTAELRELKIEGKTNIIESNSLVITCKIGAESASDYEIKLKRDGIPMDSSSEPRLSETDSFASEELKYTFTINDAKKSDEGTYKCVIEGVVESNAYEPKVYKLEKASSYDPWLLHAQESSKLECYVAGVQLSETFKWRDDDNMEDLTHDEGGYKIENTPSPTSTSSRLMRNNADTAGTKSFSCSLGDNAKQTFEVEVIAPTVTADIVFVTDNLEIDELTCTVPSQQDKFSTQWKDPDGATSNSIADKTGQFTCSVFFPTSFAGSTTGTQLTVDVYALTADTKKTIYYKPDEAKTLTCEYKVTPDLAANVNEVSFNYQFTSAGGTELQNSASNTFSWLRNVDADVNCIISVTAKEDKTVKAGTDTTTFSMKKREIYVTEDGTRYVYETPDSVSLTCRMLAAQDEEIDIAPTWYKGADVYPSTGKFTAVEGEDYVEHVLTFSGVTKETAGEYKCTWDDLDSEKILKLVVKTVSVSPSPLDKLFWMGTDSVTYSFEVGRVGNVIEYKLDTDDWTSVDMTCETAESCTASLSFTRSDEADEDKSVTVTISAKNDVSNNFLLGDVLNIPPIELILHERTLTKTVPQDFATKGYDFTMDCTARAEDNVEIKFVKRVDNEDIDDINEAAEQADYSTEFLTRKSSLSVAMTDDMTAEEIIKYHCVATYEGVDGTPGTMSTNLVTSSFILLDKPFIEVVGDSVTKTEDGRFLVPEGASYTLKITYDSRAVLDCSIHYDAGPILIETNDGTGEVLVDAAELSHSSKYEINGFYMFNDVKFELVNEYYAQLEVTEMDNSNDYMESDEGIAITVRFSGTLKDGTVQWKNELTDKVYRPERKRDATISVTQEEDYTVMVIPPGGLTESTSFKVTAQLEDDTEVKHRQYVQVIDKVQVTKHVGKDSEEDVEVVFFIALNNYKTIPDVTTTPTAKHVHKQLLLGSERQGVEFTVTVTADMARTTASMTMNIEFNEDSNTEAEITFVVLDKPVLTIAGISSISVNEGSPISMNCKDSNMRDDSDTTVQIFVNGQPASGVENEGAVGDTYSLSIRHSSYVYHNGVFTCQITDKFSDVDTVVSVSDGVDVSITEYDFTTDYVVSGGAIRLEVEFPAVLATTTIEWEDEMTGKKYNLDSNGPLKKRDAEKYVVEEGEKHIASLEIPAGIITKSTSFKVSAKTSDLSKTLFVRKYLQVIEPVHTVVLYDVGNANSVGGTVDIAINGYDGEPEIPSISTTVKSIKFTKAEDKLTLGIYLLDATWRDGGTFEITGTIKLNDASSVQFSFRFYGIDIKVERADGLEAGRAIVYNEDMSTEDRERTAFSCTLEEPADHSSTVEATITHGEDNTKLDTIKMTGNGLSVTYENLSDEMEKDGGEEEEKEVVYKCNFDVVTSYEGTRGSFHREFIVKFNPADERDWGGVIAACVLAGIILLLLILFIVYRCCIVKKRKKEKSVPPDMKLSGGPIQETNIASPETHPKFNDAVNFLDKVEGRFKKEPDIYRTFLNTLTEYRAKKINKPDLARKVAILFEGHPDLVTEFNEFIKSKKKTDQEAAENQCTVIDTEVKTNPVATNDYIITTRTPSAVPPPPHPKFTAATEFVDQVRGRFANQPEVYKTFIKLLNDFKPKKMKKSELRTEVDILFNGHPDLIEGFNDFISSKRKKAELNNENVVVDIEGIKNGEVHVNKQVTEGTV